MSFVSKKKKLESNINKSIDTNDYEKGATDLSKKVAYIKLPYFGRNCEQFGEKLKRLVEKTYFSVNLRVAFTAPSDLSKHFKFKDKIVEVEKQSFVVANARPITSELLTTLEVI